MDPIARARGHDRHTARPSAKCSPECILVDRHSVTSSKSPPEADLGEGCCDNRTCFKSVVGFPLRQIGLAFRLPCRSRRFSRESGRTGKPSANPASHRSWGSLGSMHSSTSCTSPRRPTMRFILLKLRRRSPYAGIAVGDNSRPWRLHWAIQIGEVEPFVAPGLEGVDLLGRHDRRSRRPSPRLHARGWNARRLRVRRPRRSASVDDRSGSVREGRARTTTELREVQSEASALLDDSHGRRGRPRRSSSSRSCSTRPWQKRGTRSRAGSGHWSSPMAAMRRSIAKTVGSGGCPSGSPDGSSRTEPSSFRRTSQSRTWMRCTARWSTISSTSSKRFTQVTCRS